MKDNQLSIKKHIETYHSLWCFLIQDSAQVLESLVVSFGTEKQMQTSPLKFLELEIRMDQTEETEAIKKQAKDI